MDKTTARAVFLRHPFIRFAGALLSSAALAVPGAQSVQLGYDWGYKLVEALFRQPEANAQGSWAIFSLPMIITPLFFGMTFGYFKQLLSGSWRWSVAAPLAALIWVLALAHGDYSFFSDELPWLFISLLCYLAGATLSEAISRQLHPRLKLGRVVVTGVFCLALVSGAGYYAQDASLNWTSELALYAGLLFAAGVLAALLARVRNRTAALAIALLACAPFVLANLANMFTTSISLALDQFEWGLHLGWRALLSATIITSTGFLSCALGGLCGLRLRQAKGLS
jgi:hypothetical protein